MSIETEIQRIKNAKNSMITALTGKGVRVPSGVQIDALPDLIGQISTGSSGGLVVKSGAVTDNATIETGLSSIKLIAIYKTAINATGFVHGTYTEDAGRLYYVYCGSYSQYIKTCTPTSQEPTISGGNITLTGTGNMAFTSGVTYNWYAVGEE